MRGVRIDPMTALSGVRNSVSVVLLIITVVSLLCAYWTTLAATAQQWAHDPQYSHGYLVPVFALFLLWSRRSGIRWEAFRPSGWGLPLLGAGIALRLLGAYYYFVWLDSISLLPCLAGLWLLVGGWPAWRWSWPAIAFLVFMVPLPYRLAVALAEPLQRFATGASTFALQTLGLPAVAEGNIIHLNEVEIGVIEACSGLRMLVIFLALASAMALILRGPVWQKGILLASAVPIALIVNVIRITATGILHETTTSAVANMVFHDLAGWLMMPLALSFLGVELKFLQHLILEPAASTSVHSRPTPRRASSPAPQPEARRNRQAVAAPD